MRLGLLFTARCNAQCTHCASSCGPHEASTLPDAAIFRLMREAAALGSRPLRFCLSGGEPFLDRGRLRRIVAYGHSVGGEVTCVSNGFWASSPQKARAALEDLRTAGLVSLAISTSRFHRQYVAPSRVVTALRTAKALGLRTVLKYALTVPEADDAPRIEAWARQAGADAVEIFSLLPSIRSGAQLPADDFQVRPGLPSGRCPAAVLTVRDDGRAYSCCTPGAFSAPLQLGSIHEQPLHRLVERFYLRGQQQILRERGPIAFARRIEARGLGHRLRPGYVNVCDLCTHIASDPELWSVAQEAVDEFEMAQLREVLLGEIAATPQTQGANREAPPWH